VWRPTALRKVQRSLGDVKRSREGRRESVRSGTNIKHKIVFVVKSAFSLRRSHHQARIGKNDEVLGLQEFWFRSGKRDR